MFIEKIAPEKQACKFHAVEVAAKKSWRRQRRMTRFATRLN